MKRLVVVLIAALAMAVLPAATAGAQTDREVELLEETAAELGGADAAEWTAGVAGLETALADAKAVAPDLDYSELDAAIATLKTAIDGGDIAEMEAAGLVLADAAAAVGAQVDDGTPAPTGVATGDAVPDSGPSVGLLVLAGALVALAGGALVFRRPRLT